MIRVGFIGLGSQGGPMARAIVEGGHPTTLWARRPESLEPYADTSAEYAGTPAELAERSDVVCLCVVGDDDVRGLAYGDEGLLAHMSPGDTLVIHSTIHPDTCREVGEKAAAKGIAVVDAPVSGGAPAVEAKQLLVMVGGEEADVERRVVDDQLGVADEIDELPRDLGEFRLVGEEGGRQPVDAEGGIRHLALGIDVAVEVAPRRDVVFKLDAADFDQAIAGQGIEAGGFGVEDDFTHGA